MKRSRVKVSIGHTLRDRPCVREWCKSLEDICRETETGRERERERKNGMDGARAATACVHSYSCATIVHVLPHSWRVRHGDDGIACIHNLVLKSNERRRRRRRCFAPSVPLITPSRSSDRGRQISPAAMGESRKGNAQ